MDESVVKCSGRPVYVWVAVDAYTRQPIWFGVSLTRTTENALRFLRRLRKRCLGDPVILTDRDHGIVKRSPARAGFRNHVHRPLGCVAQLSASSGTSRIGRGLSTTTSTLGKHCLCPSWTSWSYSSRGTLSGGDKNWAYPDRSLNCYFEFKALKIS